MTDDQSQASHFRLLKWAANSEGHEAVQCLRLFGRWAIWLRLSLRNAWIGIRYTDFGYTDSTRVVTIGLVPFLQLQLVWRSRPYPRTARAVEKESAIRSPQSAMERAKP